MSRSALSAGIHYLRNIAAAQCRSEDCDEQLLHAFVAGRDENAFAALVRRYGPMVLGVCRRALGHAQDAEDAFQATFLVLARKAAAVRRRGSVAAWLHTVARRLARRLRADRERRPAVPLGGHDMVYARPDESAV